MTRPVLLATVCALGACKSHRAPTPLTAAPAASVPSPKAPPMRGTASVSGIVTDDDEHPLANAHVCAVGLALVRHGDLVCTTTDARGHYLLEGIAAGAYRIGASAQGHLPRIHHPDGDGQRIGVSLYDRVHVDHADIVLPLGGVATTGEVVDERGRPLTATVILESGRAPELHGFAVADAISGRFLLWGEPLPDRVIARAPGYLVGERRDVHGSTRMQLVPASSVSGTVVDASGAPVSGAFVTDASWRSYTEDFELATVTAADGSFVLDGLSPGEHGIVATRPHGRGTASVHLGYAYAATGIRIALAPAVRIEGHVTTTAPRTTCGDPRGWLSSDADDPTRVRRYALQPGPDGALAADGIPPGTYHALQTCGRAVTDAPDVIVGAADVSDLAWTEPEGVPFTGGVSGDHGIPLAGVVVEVSAKSALLRDVRYTVTDSDGVYHLAHVQPVPYEVALGADPDREPFAPITVDGATLATLTEYRVGDLGRATIAVVDVAGAPVPNAIVEVTAASSDATTPFLLPFTTNEHGEVHTGDLAVGTYHVAVGRTGRERSTTLPHLPGSRADLTITRDRVATLHVELPTWTGAIEGIVVDAKNARVPDAMVVAYGHPTWWQLRDFTFTDATGHFRFDHVRPDARVLHVYVPGSTAEGGDAPVKPGTTQERIEVEPRTGELDLDETGTGLD